MRAGRATGEKRTGKPNIRRDSSIASIAAIEWGPNAGTLFACGAGTAFLVTQKAKALVDRDRSSSGNNPDSQSECTVAN
jgi:hypothetical protein